MHILLFINSFLFSTTINTSYIQNQRLPTSQKENYSTFLPPLDHNAPTATYYSTSKILKIGPSTPLFLTPLSIVYTVSYSTIYFILFLPFSKNRNTKEPQKVTTSQYSQLTRTSSKTRTPSAKYTTSCTIYYISPYFPLKAKLAL